MFLQEEVNSELKSRFRELDEIDKELDDFISHPDQINEQNIERLILNSYLLSSQKYGIKIQKIIQGFLNAKPVNQQTRKGDFEINGKFFEVKAGLCNNSWKKKRVVQFRHQHEYDYDILIYYNIDDQKFSITFAEHNKIIELFSLNGFSKSNSHNQQSGEWSFNIEKEIESALAPYSVNNFLSLKLLIDIEGQQE